MANEAGAVVINFDRQRFERAPDILADITHKYLDKLGRDIEQWIFEHAPKDTSVNAEAVTHTIQSTGRGEFELIIFSDVPGARQALETGRAPGRKPPLDKILGWVRRRSLSPTERGRVFSVGRRVGSTYKTRGLPNPVALASLSVGGEASATDMRIARKVQTKIARRGTKAPRIFTRALQETRDLQLHALSEITREASRFI